MKNKQLVINMLATIIAFVINIGISFFLTPYITNNIGEDAYGFISLANNFVTYASLVTIALNSMAGRFITIKIHKNEIEEANKYFTSILLANIFFTIVLIVPSAVVVFCLEDLLAIPSTILMDVKLLFIFVFINFFLSIINATYSTSTFVRNRLDLSSKINIVSYIMRAGLLLLLFAFFKPRVSYVGFVSCIISIYILIMNIYYTKKILPEVSVSRKYLDIKKLIQIIKSGIWNTITKLGQILSDGLDLLITNIFITPTAMGQFAIVKTITTSLSSFISTFSGVFQPQQTIDYAKGDLDVVVDDLKFSMKLTSVISNIPYVFLAVFGYTFFKLWVPEVDTNLLNTLSIVSILSQLTLSSIVPLWQIFTITNKLKVNSLVTIGTGLLNILIVFILMKTTDLRVVAIAGVSSVTAVIKNITYTPMYSAHCLGVSKKTFYPEIMRNLFVTLLMLILNCGLALVIPISSWFGLVIMLGISVILGLVINYFLLFSKEERGYVIDIIKKVVNKVPFIKNLIWNTRLKLRNLYWYYYGREAINNNKIIIDHFSGKGYSDNPKYIAEELIRRNPQYDIVCVLNEKTASNIECIPSYIRTVILGTKEWIYECCTAKVWIGNTRKTYFYRKRREQYYIQTWHGGIGIKQIEKDAEEQLDKKYVKYAKKDSKAMDLLISDSLWQTKMFKNAFWYDGQIIQCGLPRNDIFFDNKKNKEIVKQFNKKFNLSKKVLKILYAPTFRKSMNTDIYNLDFNKIIKSFEKQFNQEAVVLVKLHPNVIHLASNIKYSQKVINANTNFDTQELEIYADILITDYSSMMFDYLLMKKPCFVYANDYNNYIKERKLYFELSELPFPFSMNDKELVASIKSFNMEEYLNNINEFSSREKIINDGIACQTIANLIEQKIRE